MRVFALAVCFLYAGLLAAQEPIGWQAEKAEKDGDVVKAWLLYSQAAALDPANRKYAGKAMTLRGAALDKSQIVVNKDSLALPDIDPEIVRALTQDELVELKRLRPPMQLKPKAGRQRFQFDAPIRLVASDVLKACGIEPVFDSTFDATQRVRIHLDDASCVEAIQALETAGAIFLSPISDTVAMVVRETPDKRREQDAVAAISIPMPEPISVQEAQEAGRSVQQMLEIQKFAIDPTRRIVVMRDRAWKLRSAELVMQELMTRRPEVYVDLEMVQVAKQRDMRFGLNLQNMTEIVNFGGLWNSVVAPPSGYAAFLTFGGGLTLFGIGITTANVFASMTDSQTSVMQRATVRSLDSQPAEFLFGQRFPIQVQAYIGPGSDSPDAFMPPPQIQFENLGLTLKVTPRVHADGDVTLNVDSEFKVLTGQSLNGIPVISNRKYVGQVRLRQGEWAVAAGLMTKMDSKGFTGIAGLSQVPGAGMLLRDNTWSKTEGELLIILKPRIVNTGPLDVKTTPIWVGTETKPLPPV